MYTESLLPPFVDWLLPAMRWWAVVVAVLAVVAIVVGLLLAVFRYGPAGAVNTVLGVIRNGFIELVQLSPRRTLALTWLAVKESIRRRIVVGFGVFILLLLFAGWFLDPGTTDPAKLYLSFVLTATGYLVPLLALLISTFSLPNDIRSRTLYTVVTKPVRSSEIVLGRMLGFTAIGTALLGIMAVISYFFVTTGLRHTHELAPDDLRPVAQAGSGGGRAMAGDTARAQGHRHQVRIDAEGNPRVETASGHWHEITVRGEGADAVYTLGPPQGHLVARVPVHGKLSFRDANGMDKSQGVNVGDEWMYRSYISGGTPEAAMWTFSGLRQEDYPDGLPVEMIIGVFRTHKGNIEKGVNGSLAVRNPDTGLTVETRVFESKEFVENSFIVPARITSFSSSEVIARKRETDEGVTMTPLALDPSLAEKPEYNLFKDLVTGDGRVEIWLRCLDAGQYFGAAEPDAYLRAADAPFWLNFAKGYFGIWLQMILVIGFGVMFSTFLSGPVAMIATLGALLGGYFNEFMYSLAVGLTEEGQKVYGGGPLESLIRLVKQQNIMTEMDPSIGATVAKMFDTVARFGLQVMSNVLPSFGDLSYSSYVASGFDVSMNVILIRAVTALGFLAPVFVAAYMFLKNREVAQ
jgi:ABC-type transport system involved in multi-copper enzyme maturation permease subunit